MEIKSSKTTTQTQIFVIPFHARAMNSRSMLWCETNTRNKWNLGNFLFSLGIRTMLFSYLHTHARTNTCKSDAFWKKFRAKINFSSSGRFFPSAQRNQFLCFLVGYKKTWMCVLKRWFFGFGSKKIPLCFHAFSAVLSLAWQGWCMCSFKYSFSLAQRLIRSYIWWSVCCVLWKSRVPEKAKDVKVGKTPCDVFFLMKVTLQLRKLQTHFFKRS